MENKLTQEELERFNSIRNRFFDLKSEIADIAVNQDQLERRRIQTLENYSFAHNELMNEQKIIFDKFGKCRVDYSTGEIHINS